MRFGVFTTVKSCVLLSYDISSLVSFIGTCCLHLQDGGVDENISDYMVSALKTTIHRSIYSFGNNLSLSRMISAFMFTVLCTDTT